MCKVAICTCDADIASYMNGGYAASAQSCMGAALQHQFRILPATEATGAVTTVSWWLSESACDASQPKQFFKSV